MWMALLTLTLSGCSYDQSLRGTFAPSAPAAADLPEEEVNLDDAEEELETCNETDPVVLFVSPDDSNSMSAPVQVRTGNYDPRVALRTWEFFNYYTWDYAPAEPGLLALDVQLDRRDGTDSGYVMQVAVTSETITRNTRDPMNITFVMDASGSMSGKPIELSRQVMRDIASQLKDGDIVSVVTWDTRNAVLLDGLQVTGRNDRDLLDAIDTLEASGGTDLANGLKEGYRLAEENRRIDRINRVLLVSDGGANVGVTDEEIIGGGAGAQDEDGIYLIGVGVGDHINDYLMDRVTDLGRGASVFIDSEGESTKMFRDRFMETMSVAARDVQIRYDLPPGWEVLEFSGEEISEVQEEVQPQHIAPSDSVVLHQHLDDCVGAADSAEIGVTVTYQDAVTFEAREVSGTWTLGELLTGNHTELRKGEAVFAYARAMTPEHRDDPQARQQAEVAVLNALRVHPEDPDLLEMLGILQ